MHYHQKQHHIARSNPGFLVDQIMKAAKVGGGGGKKAERRKMTIAEARPLIEDGETERLLDEVDIPKEAIGK